MPELQLRPLLAHAPERTPPRRWRVTLFAGALAVLGMLIAWAAVTAGQDVRRSREILQMNYNRVYWENELNKARLAHEPADKIQKLEATLAKYPANGRVISYARWGRQFTPWDGYRYEEIIDQGYVYHQVDASPKEKEDSLMDVGGPERRAKNVVWYPLYPVLGWMVSKALGIPSHHALTVVSWICCLLASLAMFHYARRHYYNRMPQLEVGGGEALAAEAHPSRRWDLTPQDTAALFAVAALLFGPCSVFLYANFTESLFVLLLACFLYCMQARWWWRAALVAAVASACRSQGVLFGPVLALTYLLRSDSRDPFKKIGIAALFGIIAATGLACYMLFLYTHFGDPLAFMHAQRYWNVGLGYEQIRYALNPAHALTRVFQLAFFNGPVDWPRLWEALCLIWPPIVLLILGGRYLSFELEVIGWMMWGLPYVSNSLAGNPPMDTQWMSMGRFMAVMIPLHIILGSVLVRLRWASVAFLVLWSSAFAIFCFLYGTGAWVG
jgi:hypothetical protein